jgi:molybdopterin molybdotransferase
MESLTGYLEALEMIQARSEPGLPIESEYCELQKSLGRILANDLISPEFVPAFDNSAMDGYAVRSWDTLSASDSHPVELLIVGSALAGTDLETKVSERNTSERTCIEITTGARVPEGTERGKWDCVVRLENVQRVNRDDQEWIILREPLKLGNDIRKKGTDIAEGETVFLKGTQIEPKHFLTLASLGFSKIPCIRKLKIALISTGSEVVSFDTKDLGPHQIRNSTAPYLQAELSNWPCEVDWIGAIEDDPQSLIRCFGNLKANDYDLWITTGAVSVGKKDYVLPCLEKLGFQIGFHRTAIRPGKPVLFGTFQDAKAKVIGLPGNPVSTMVGFRFFVVPLLRTMLGIGPECAERAVTLNAVKKPGALRCFYKGLMKKARTEASSNALSVEILNGQESYRVGPLQQANVWVCFEEEQAEFPMGSQVQVFPIQTFQGGL